MRVRKLDANGDMTFGQGLANFWVDQVEGVRQVVTTRLKFWQGEWWLDTSEGTPYSSSILGKYTEETREPALVLRVYGSIGVVEVTRYEEAPLANVPRGTQIFIDITSIFGVTTIEVIK